MEKHGTVSYDLTWRQAAYHEAGHAVACLLLGHPPYIMQIGGKSGSLDNGGETQYVDSGVLPRGLAFGMVFSEARFVIAMAGPAAEQIECGHPMDWDLTNRIGNIAAISRYLCEPLHGMHARPELQRRSTTRAFGANAKATALLSETAATSAVVALAEVLLDKRCLSRLQMIAAIDDAAPGLPIAREGMKGVPDIVGDATVNDI